MEHLFTVTVNGVLKHLPCTDTTISASTAPPPRTWVKLFVNQRIAAAFLIEETFEEAVRRRTQARAQ